MRTEEQKRAHAIAERLRLRAKGVAERVAAVTTLADLFDRFCAPEPNTGCMLFIGYLDSNIRGRVRFAGKTQNAPRVAFYLANGHWPTPNALHKCDTPACCEPGHLSEGTQRENVADMMRKGRYNRNRALPVGSKHHAAKLTEGQVREIRASTDRGVDLAARFVVTSTLVCSIRKGKGWRHV